MAADNLTPSQELFAHLAVTEPNKSAAYRLAYNAENMKPSTVSREAYKLARHPKVATKIRELQAQLQKRLGWNTDQLVNMQGNIFESAYVAGDWGQATAALREIAKLVGAYEQPEGLSIINIFGMESYDFSEFEPAEISAIIRFIRMVVGARRESEEGAAGSVGSSSGLSQLGTGSDRG